MSSRRLLPGVLMRVRGQEHEAEVIGRDPSHRHRIRCLGPGEEHGKEHLVWWNKLRVVAGRVSWHRLDPPALYES